MTLLGGLPAILVAMDNEFAALAAAAEPEGRAKRRGGVRFQPGRLAGREVLLVESGLGLTQAASAATLAVAEFGATGLISTGSAGGMGAEVQVGDVVVGTEALYSLADATAFGHYSLGQIPKMPRRFTAVPEAIGLLRGSGGREVHFGLVISADSFISAHNYAEVMGRFPDAMATDMETAAIAQVAHSFRVPWVAIRGISDLCGPGAATDNETHAHNVTSRSVELICLLFA